MQTTGTLPGVAEQISLRQFAGTIIYEEIARIPGKNKKEKALHDAGISDSTLRNMRNGVESVRLEAYWHIAAALDLPTHFFDYIIAGDMTRIRRLAGVREDLRQHVLESMAELTMPRGRRATDRRRRMGR